MRVSSSRFLQRCALALVSLSGCEPEESANNKPGDTTDSTPDTCEVVVLSTDPLDGAVDVPVNSSVRFTLNQPDTSAVITSDIPGSMVISADGLELSWVPNTTLAPLTTYSATLTVCEEDTEEQTTVTFTTKGGDPRIGKVYAPDLSDAEVTDPPGVGAVFSSLLDERFLLGVAGISGDRIQLAISMEAEGGGEASCDPVGPLPEGDFSADPYFVVGPTAISFATGDTSVRVYDFTMEGTFAAGGIEAGQASGLVDVRDVAEAFPELGYSGPGLCDFLVSFGAVCEACPDGENLCIRTAARAINAPETSGPPLTEGANVCPDCGCGQTQPAGAALLGGVLSLLWRRGRRRGGLG